MRKSGRLVITLDFELLWGVRDHADRNSYGESVLGARTAIPRMLDMFTENGVHATWATVGFLFCVDKDELLESLPMERPTYDDPTLSNYNYIQEIGQNESTDPYYFAPSLIERIAHAPGQEIGTHTLSHYYCLESGQTTDAFEADLLAAQAIAARRGITLRSIVFPRNQYGTEHLSICQRLGFSAFRGNPDAWAYAPTRVAEQQKLTRRAVRLLDAYLDVCGSKTFEHETTPFTNVPASQFLRPCSASLAALHPLHRTNIKHGMRTAAENGLSYHLWWHPHNFGRNLDANLRALSEIVHEFTQLREQYGMRSCTMAEMSSG